MIIPRKRWKEIIEKDLVVRGLEKKECTRMLFMEAWLQKPAHPLLQRKQAEFQVDKNN